MGSPAASLPDQSAPTGLGTKTVADLVSPDTKMTVDGINATVTGELKEIDYPEFSSDPSETHGYFFPLSVDKKYQGHTIGVFSSATGNKKTSTDLNWVLKVKDENTKFTVTDETPDMPLASNIMRVSAAPMSASSPVTIMEVTFKGATFENKEGPKPEVHDAEVATCVVADKEGVNNAGAATIKSFTKVEAGDQYPNAHTLVTINAQLSALKEYKGANNQTKKWIPVVMTFTQDGKPVTDNVTHPYSVANGIDLVPATQMLKSGSGNVAVEWIDPTGPSARDTGTDVVKYTFADGSAVYVRYKFEALPEPEPKPLVVATARAADKAGVTNVGVFTVETPVFEAADNVRFNEDHYNVTIKAPYFGLAETTNPSQLKKRWMPVVLTFTQDGKDVTADLLPSSEDPVDGITTYPETQFITAGDSGKKVACQWVAADSIYGNDDNRLAKFVLKDKKTTAYIHWKFEDTFPWVTSARIGDQDAIENHATEKNGLTIKSVTYVKADSGKEAHSLVTIEGDLTQIQEVQSGGAPTKERWVPVVLTFAQNGKDLTPNMTTPNTEANGIDLYDENKFIKDGSADKKVAVEWIDSEGNAAKYDETHGYATYAVKGTDTKIYVGYKFVNTPKE